MPSVSDHVRRDAGHASRTLIRIRVMQYVRRMDDEAKSDIDQAIAEATREGLAIDGSKIGAEAANRSLASYGFDKLLEILEADATPQAIEDRSDPFA